MDCKTAQRFLADSDHLPNHSARLVQQHLLECSDCRVAQQRSLRLQQLLTVKRHETPGVDYFDTFLGDFKRRLAIETAPRVGWFDRLLAGVRLHAAFRMRYSFAHALGIVFAVGLIWRGVSTSETGDSVATPEPYFGVPQLSSGTARPPQSTPPTISSALPAPSYGMLSLPESFVFPGSAPGSDFHSPRYVLERLALTPASYEVDSFHF